jgi:hypothetical protein
MGDVGGCHELRVSDFALGCQSTIAWLDQELSACEIDGESIRRTVPFVESRHRYDTAESAASGHTRLSGLSMAIVSSSFA